LARFRLAVPDVAWAYPLTAAMLKDGEHDVIVGTPSETAIRFSDPKARVDAALLSPIEYARHGSSSFVVPGIAVSVPHPSAACRLSIRAGARSIGSIASDLRSTSDVFLTSLLLKEKFPSLAPGASGGPTIVPVRNVADASFDTVDAILASPVFPSSDDGNVFTLDVYEEWRDLVEAPLVVAFWVAREATYGLDLLRLVHASAERGRSQLDRIAASFAGGRAADVSALLSFWSSFSFDMNDSVVDSVDDVYRLAYEHGSFGDVPDLTFLEPGSGEA
jgi:predicted solute-binding protein